MCFHRSRKAAEKSMQSIGKKIHYHFQSLGWALTAPLCFALHYLPRSSASIPCFSASSTQIPSCNILRVGLIVGGWSVGWCGGMGVCMCVWLYLAHDSRVCINPTLLFCCVVYSLCCPTMHRPCKKNSLN